MTDKAIERKIKNLTTSKIFKVVNEVVNSDIEARFWTYINSCVHCGLCAEACHFYVSNNRNPKFSPVAKVKRTLGKIIKNKTNFDKELLRGIVEIAHTECNLCKRCVLYCPGGIDTAYLITIVRRIIHKLGLTPSYIQDTAHSHSANSNQMWVKEDEWIDTLQWQEEELWSVSPNFSIPLDKDGAEVMYSVIAPEPKFQPNLIYQASVLMNYVKIDWTMPSSAGWDNSDMAMFTGDYELMGRLKKEHFDLAESLHVNKIVMGECGHAFRSVYDTGNRWLSWSEPPISIVHAVEFYFDLLSSKQLQFDKKLEISATLHDPCNIVRGAGLHNKSRYVADHLCENIVEMYPNKEFNYCCSAGGGVINCGPPYKKARMNSGREKAKQLFDAKSRGATIVIAPCHNCHSGLKDLIDFYGIGLEVKFFIDLIYENLIKSNKLEN